MNVNELRLGNYVFHNERDFSKERDIFTGEYPIKTSVMSVFTINPNGASLEINNGNPCDKSLFYPIPITQMVLLSCGFCEAEPFYYSHNTVPNVFIEKDATKSGYKVTLSGVNGDAICNVNFLHELQNLYFAIMGEELSVNTGTILP